MFDNILFLNILLSNTVLKVKTVSVHFNGYRSTSYQLLNNTVCLTLQFVIGTLNCFTTIDHCFNLYRANSYKHLISNILL